MDLDFKTIIFSEEDSIGLITLNRPEKLNAFNQLMLDELLNAFDYIDNKDTIKAVIITGAGRAFCAGADLSAGEDTFNSEFDNSSDYKEDFKRDSGGLLTLRMYKCVKPILIACNGDAVGIGATMQLAADIRIASKSSRYGFPFARRGIAPDACSSWFLPKIVGISKSLEWCYSGEIFSAQHAYDAGLVSYLFEPEDLLNETIKIAGKFMVNSSPVSIALTRQMIWDLSSKDSPEDAHIIDSKVIASRGASDDAKEGVMSFLEKRSANFNDTVSKKMPSFFPWTLSRFKKKK